MPKISVIVPVYNVEPYLHRCIDSVLAQSFTDFELILIVDGSPDNCGAICDDYAQKDDRVRAFHQNNSGQSAARNIGMDAAQGEWIAFVDSDDWIHKDYLMILLSGAEKDADVVICDCLVSSNGREENLDYTHSKFQTISLGEIQKNHYANTRVWGRLYRKSAVSDLRFIPGTEPTEDSCFNELFYKETMKFRITDAKLYYYYMRPDSAIHTCFEKGILNSIGPLLEQLKWIETPEKRKRIIKRCYKYVLSARYSGMYTQDCSDVFDRSKQLLKKLNQYLPELETKERTLFWVFSTFPSLYRTWRIHDDPSLREYERNKKLLYRVNTKNRQ